MTSRARRPFTRLGCRQAGPRDMLIGMNEDDRARSKRAVQRSATMQVRLTQQHPGREHDFSPVSGAPAVALAVELSRVAWTLAGNALPSYSRETMPISVSRRAAP
jgi:hypothetical protein